MSSTNSKIVTLPAVNEPLVPIREYVSDFGEDELDAAVESSATGEVKFTLRERSSGRDQITAVHTYGEQRESYPFTVTDHNRGLCAYNRHSDGKMAPPHIRRALIEFGYHDTTGLPESPVWFPEYTRTILPMLNGCLQAADSELVRNLLHSYLIHLRGTLQAAYIVTRYESPTDVPDELVGTVFEGGEESPLSGVESWDAIEQRVMQWELTTAEWQFDGSFLPQPPRSDPGEWATYLFDEHDDRDPNEVEQDLAEHLAESPIIPFVTDASQITEMDGQGLDPEEGAEIRIKEPDSPETGDYIRTIQYGPDSVVQHEFRIITPIGESQQGECVFENRDPDTALPPYPAVHAVTTSGYNVQNAPSFRLDATPTELLKNSYEVAREVFTTPPAEEVFEHQLDIIRQPLVVLLYALTAVEIAGAESVDSVATAFTQASVGKPVASALDRSEAKTKRIVIEAVRENHPDASAIETAYNDSGIPDRLHITRSGVFPDDLRDL